MGRGWGVGKKNSLAPLVENPRPPVELLSTPISAPQPILATVSVYRTFFVLPPEQKLFLDKNIFIASVIKFFYAFRKKLK